MPSSALPPLDVVGPTGEPITVTSISRTTTVADLVGALGRRHPSGLTVEDRPVRPADRLVDIHDLRRGARLAFRAPHDRDGRPSSCDDRTGHAIVEVAIVAGPACTAWTPLPTGRHLVGRAAAAAVPIDDPTVEAHAGYLDVTPQGRVRFTQLTGVAPARLDGEVAGPSDEVAIGARLRLGASVIQIRPAGSLDGGEDVRSSTNAATAGTISAHAADPWRRVVHRAPVIERAWTATPVTAPSSDSRPAMPTPVGLVGAGVAAVGGTALAFALGNPMFVLFAALGAVTAAGSWLAAVVVACRRRRSHRRARTVADDRFRAELDRLRADRVAHQRHRYADLPTTLLEPRVGAAGLWRLRVGGADRLLATIGIGRVHWSPPIEAPDRTPLDASLLLAVEHCGRLDGVPAPLVLAPGDGVAIRGRQDATRALARSIIVQLATWVGPADWQLVVVTRRPDLWTWAAWLPHLAGHGAVVEVDARGDRPDVLGAIDVERRTVVVVDAPEALVSRTGWLRRFLSASNASTVALVGDGDTVPTICGRVLVLGSMGTASWIGDPSADDHATDIEISGLGFDAAESAARALAPLVDPEADERGGSAPASVTFGEVVEETLGSVSDPPEHMARAIADRWRAGGGDPAPIAPIGLTAQGRIDLDLVRDGPHGLLAGTTGSGKSELLRTVVVSLAAHVAPEHLNFVLVDYKGGATFDRCTALPHTVGVVTDLDEGLAERALVSLDAEVDRRERLLRDVAASDLTDYRARADTQPIARLVVVVDEFAALATELPGFLTALVSVAQRGRSLGIHLLLATQRPAGVVSDDIRANTNLRLALRLHDASDAIDVIGDRLPSTFPRAAVGRAALRLGPDELVVFQTAHCTGAVGPAGASLSVAGPAATRAAAGPDVGRSELDVMVDAIRLAAERRTDPVVVQRPWLDPLPRELAVDSLDALLDDDDRSAGPPPIGVVDDPQQQARRALRWRPCDGSLSLVGSVGSGTTSALIALATSLCRSAPASELHLYVVDARGDERLAALAALAHCAGVVRPTEPERLHRLLARLVAIVDRRIASGRSDDPDVVLLVDGAASLRTALGSVERAETFELLQRVLVDGPPVGVPCVTVHDGSAPIPVADRWVFHLGDDAGGRVPGVVPVPAGVPGRLRVASSGLEAQVGLGAAGLASLPTRDDDRSGPEEIRELPAQVTDRDLRTMMGGSRVRAASGTGDGATSLPLGVGADELGPASLDVPDGEHVLVIGAARTGVSTTVARCAAAFAECVPDLAVVFVGRDGLDDDVLAGGRGRTLLVVDDAHRRDDVRFAEVVRGEHPGVTLLAGARADVVRSSYGHWTREVARSRCGVVMASRDDPDGDVLGVSLPRRGLIAPRPGLAWIVDGGPLRQVQVVEKMAR